MRKAIPPLFLLASVFMWVACDTEQPTGPVDLDASFEILDGANNGAFDHFLWLPPLVNQPPTSGTFDPTLDPRVEICLLKGVDLDCTDQEPGKFTREYGPAAHLIGVDAVGQKYHLDWDTKAFDLTDDAPYRISVWLGSVQLGLLDIQFDATGTAIKRLRDDEIVPLNSGLTLPIKFRLEEEIRSESEIEYDVSFHSDRDGDLDVYLLDLETGLDLNITKNDGILDGTANWHPDGEHIIFTSDRANPGGHPHLYTMNSDGTNVQPLGTGLIEGWQAEYSPNPNLELKIVFQRGWPPVSIDEEDLWAVCGQDDSKWDDDCWDLSMVGREHDIWVMNADGTDQRQLTDKDHTWPYDPFEDWSPTWHPDGDKVTFARSHNSFKDHFDFWDDCLGTSGDPSNPGPPVWEDPGCYWNFDIVSVDVSNPSNEWTRHTYNPGADHRTPRWSPDQNMNVLTVEARDNGNLVAFKPAATSFDEWNAGGLFHFLMESSQNPSWSQTGKVAFTNLQAGDFGQIFLAEDWTDWLNGNGEFDLLVGSSDAENSWARFRPGH